MKVVIMVPKLPYLLRYNSPLPRALGYDVWYIDTICINVFKCRPMHGYIPLGLGLQDPCSKGAQISCFVPRSRIPKLRHWL